MITAAPSDKERQGVCIPYAWLLEDAESKDTARLREEFERTCGMLAAKVMSLASRTTPLSQAEQRTLTSSLEGLVELQQLLYSQEDL